MNQDARGWRIALVPDALLNPSPEQAGAAQTLRLLEQHGYGLLQLPPSDDSGDPGLLLAVIADQIAEYTRHGYVAVAVGLHDQPGAGLHWRRLTALLRHRGIAPPPRYIYGSARDSAAEHGRLSSFLTTQDISDEEKRRWRV